ncbi:charged multivesicular body protein 7-like [Amphibalanus amphitrite]|uniref:charged multivesicular body protein 7-like n=1 Tax=Amphibalanus amphitrite TaxID=1232801 RepID=UPI001C915627|nr:charged multivesicular body protein 7-like [Amphibalanus amphitrite]XP_043228614.1 charged multivesicular body protein 7-like [Amphibalanus amphitrite]
MAAVPANWREDEMVVGALFSPFRSREVNPQGYDTKMAFWRQELADVCRKQRRLQLSRRRLEAEHIVGCHRPSCLREVFTNLRRTGEAVAVSELRHQCAASTGWVAWGTEMLVWRPCRYCWGLARRTIWPEPDEENVVLMAALKEASDELYSRHLAHLAAEQPAAGALILTDRLHALHRDLLASRSDLELALLQLQHQGRVTVTEVDGRPAVKFRLEGEPDRRPTVTELEKGVLRLTLVESTLRERVEQLETSQEELRAKAKALLKTGQREAAKKHLRQWKKTQALLDKRQTTLDNVQGMLHAIEESKHNRKVMEALSRGTAAIKGAFGDVTIDKVDQVVADCQEMLEDQEDMDALLARPISPGDAAEAAELEEELSELMGGTAAAATPQKQPPTPRQRGRQELPATPPRAEPKDLPSPPTVSPGKMSEGSKTPRVRLIAPTLEV